MCRASAFTGFLALILAPRILFATPILAPVPPAGPVASASTIAIPIQISNVTNLFAFQFDLSYDPASLQLDSISEGQFLPSAGSTFFVPGFIDNTSGLASFTADTLLGAIAGASGSGNLATLDFTTQAAGTSSLVLSNVILLNPQFSDIAFATTSATFPVSGVPEPGTIWLFFAGMLALFPALRNTRLS